MTKDDLEREANRLILRAKKQMEERADFATLWVLHFDGGWHPFELPEFAANLMNDGTAKDIIFDYFRSLVRQTQADGVLFASDTWMAKVTPEGDKHYDTPEWEKHHAQGFVELMKLGWVMREEAIIVTAQNETDALLVTQTYRRLAGNRIHLLQSKRQWQLQSKFGGRAKMFGDLSKNNCK